MATYLKRTSKLFDISLSRNSVDVTLRDLMCSICRGILIEPVTLPCTHNLCLRCLKGTFEHNSLSCPLCRIRVGSWLRTATKSESLVNSELWELIRTKFPKEVESKYNATEEDSTLDTDYEVTDRILSTAGEIRREYEVQLQMARKEMLCQREVERIASEALIRKIQAEEQQQQLVQIAQDKLLAKSLAKRQSIEKNKGALKYYNDCLKTLSPTCLGVEAHLKTKHKSREMSLTKSKESENHRNTLVKYRDNCEQQTSNRTFISDSQPNQYVISGTLNVNKGFLPQELQISSTEKEAGISMTIKKKDMSLIKKSNTNNFSPQPSCSSNMKIYGLQSKEELHVPNDVLSSKKKTLDVEICMTAVANEARIGSAESGGSHDSINQEIHHFKPIKAMPRTPLLMSPEGRQINPKVIRVIPIAKRVSHALLQPPSPTRFKKITGCSWSAFNGKARIEAQKVNPCTSSKKESNDKANKLQFQTAQSSSLSNNVLKSKICESDCRLISEISIDNNKNYTKNVNKVVNGAIKIAKKPQSEQFNSDEKSKSHQRVGAKRKQNSRKRHAIEPTMERNSQCVHVQEMFPENNVAMENIADRIKRRKTAIVQNTANVMELSRRNTRKNTAGIVETTSKRKLLTKESARTKRQKAIDKCNMEQVKVTEVKDIKEPCLEKSSSRSSVSDEDEIIKEQERIEKMVLQEKQDFELALRLQAQFDEMEKLAGRTRGSRRALESATLSVPETLTSVKQNSTTLPRERKKTSTRIQRCRQPQKTVS